MEHINWYPGHMKKTRELIQENLKLVDAVLEVIDARIPRSSRNPIIDELVKEKKRILVFNKSDLADNEATKAWAEEFQRQGFLSLTTNCMSGEGTVRLLKRLENLQEEKNRGQARKKPYRLMIVGVPNVGKSSLVNRLLGEDRVIVSPIAGTTRDSIDTPFEKDGEQYLLIDTAGIRRKSKVNEDIEKFSVLRAVAAIERCDVCLLMIDAQEGITEQDKKIAGIAHEAGKGIVVVVNKWDLLEKDNHTMNDFKKEIARELTFMSYAPSVFISALTGQRVDNVIAMAKYVAENRAMRIPTGQLNSLITDATMMKQPPSDKGKRLKIYYVTQVGVKPPLFSFKINSRPLMHFSYSRYLENKIRESFGFEGTPLKFVFREKGEKEDV